MDGQQNDSHPSDRQLDSKSVELPLDQAQRVIVDKESNSFLLLSVSDDPIYIGKGSFPYDDFSPYSKVQIFSESIAFSGDLLSPNGISLSCNDITIIHRVTIDATGAAGADQVIKVSEAQVGHNGGSINFYIQDGSDEVSKHLSFVTKGGKGGDVLIRNARAGNGGNGGHSARIFQSRYSALLGSIYEFLNRKDASTENFNSPVHKNDPIYLSAFQLITMAGKAMLTREKFKPIQDLYELLSGIDGIDCKVEGLVRKVKFVRNPVEDLAHRQGGNFRVAVSFQGGYPGSGKDVPAETGKKGKEGSDTCLFLSTYNPDIAKATFAFVHPEQCAMLLDRAKVFYYMGSPELRLQAEILFRRLVQKLSFLPTDPLSRARTESSIFSLESLSKFESIKTEAVNQLTNLTAGVGFNGHPDNWTPRASYTFYKDALDTAFDDHAALENAYIEYHAALAENQKLTHSIGLALQQTSQMINSVTKDINDLFKQLWDTENIIQTLTGPVMSTHFVLLDAFNYLEKRIRNDFELSVPQLMNALRNFAFGPTSLMAGMEGLNLIWEGSSSVPDIQGNPINKNLIIRKIQHGEATVKSIKDTLDMELDGTFKLDDPSAARLMTAEEDMMSFLEAYANSSFVNVIDEMKDKYDAFIKAIVARNEQVVHYNVLLKLWISKIDSKNDYKKKEKDLRGRDIEATDQNLPSITAYMGDIYHSSRARIMHLLDNLIRSLNFRGLTRFDIFHLAFEGTEPDKVPLSITSSVLLSARSRIEYEFTQVVENWGGPPSRFPPDFDHDKIGKRIFLSKSQRLSLIEKQRVTVKIPVVKKDTITPSPFSNCCNVRIYRVRFGFTGLIATKRAFVSISLTHSGDEIIVDYKDSNHQFRHSPITTIYSFYIDPDGTTHPEDNGNISGVDVDEMVKTYAAPGPFTEWTVDFSASQTNRLDFSEVTEAYFDFCGTNYAFP